MIAANVVKKRISYTRFQVRGDEGISLVASAQFLNGLYIMAQETSFDKTFRYQNCAKGSRLLFQ
jgi:hypothetical protein